MQEGFIGRPTVYAPSVTDARSINISNVNITNVTNVTNVSSTSFHTGCGHWKHKRRKGKRGKFGKRGNHAPKLIRFCASGGFLDYDKASRMSKREMCHEATNVVRHSVRGLSSCAGVFASSAGKAARSIAGGIHDMVSAFFS